jgi:hypothetical protein
VAASLGLGVTAVLLDQRLEGIGVVSSGIPDVQRPQLPFDGRTTGPALHPTPVDGVGGDGQGGIGPIGRPGQVVDGPLTPAGLAGEHTGRHIPSVPHGGRLYTCSMVVDGSGEGPTGMAFTDGAYDPRGMVMPPKATDDQSKLLADMRARVESAAAEIDRLTSELMAREEWVDELESIMDMVLGLLDAPVVVVGDDRRIRALSRGAGEHLTGDAVVGKPLSSVVAEDVFAALEARLATAASGSNEWDVDGAEPGSMPLDVQPLPSGGVVVVFGAG